MSKEELEKILKELSSASVGLEEMFYGAYNNVDYFMDKEQREKDIYEAEQYIDALNLALKKLKKLK